MVPIYILLLLLLLLLLLFVIIYIIYIRSSTMSTAPPSIETFFDFVFPFPPFFPPFFLRVGGEKIQTKTLNPACTKKKQKKKKGGVGNQRLRSDLSMMMTKGEKKEQNRHFTYLITLTPNKIHHHGI